MNVYYVILTVKLKMKTNHDIHCDCLYLISQVQEQQVIKWYPFSYDNKEKSFPEEIARLLSVGSALGEDPRLVPSNHTYRL